jgi:hypothetical protein
MSFNRYFPLLAAAFFLVPVTAQAQAIECGNFPTTSGAVPDAVIEACSESVVVATQNVGPSDASGGVHNNSAEGEAFVTFEQALPEFFTTVAPNITQNPDGFINAGDFAGNDLSVWYVLDNVNNFFSVDVATGDVLFLGTTDTPPNSETWTGMTWDYDTSQMYAVSAGSNSSSLFTIDVADGTVELVAPITVADPAASLPIAIASDPADGQLYLVDLGTDELLTLDKATGETAVVGPLGIDANFGQGMDFDNDDGTLYYYSVTATPTTELRTIDTATGDATNIVGVLGEADPGGLNQMGAGSSVTMLAGVANEDNATAGSFELTSVYPNPLRSNGSVALRLDRAEQVRVAVYDVLGREVALLHDGVLSADRHAFAVEAEGMPSGVYFVSAKGETFSETRKFVVTQ